MLLDALAPLGLCEREGPLRVFKIIYLLISIARVLIPVIIIIMGTKDLMNAILQSNTDEMKKAPAIFIKRLIAGLAIFLIPSFIDAIFNMVSGYEKTPSQFASCSVCLTNGKDCDTLIATAIETEKSLRDAERKDTRAKFELSDADIANWEKHKAERLKRQQERKNNPSSQTTDGDNITYDTTVTNGETKYFNSRNVSQISGLSVQELTNILQNNKAYNGKAKMYVPYAQALIDAERNHGVNAFYLIGVYSLESGWLGSTLTKECNNIGGVKFYSSKPYGNGKMTYQCRGQWAGFDSIDGFIDYQSSLLERAYLTPGASHYYGTSVADVAKDYGHSSGVNSIIQIAMKVSSEY